MKFFRLLIPAAAMTVLILDAQTALAGAQAGLELCVRSVIPSLFPFLFLSVMLTGGATDSLSKILGPLGRLCRISKGGESYLVVGIIGGYPVGAQCISRAYRCGQIDRETAHRMLGFCSNAGPSFIFGFLSASFAPQALWLLWGIHILSAILTGILLPGGAKDHVSEGASAPISPVSALDQSIRTMGLICGWVLVFRVLLAFLRRWFLWMLPEWTDILFSGLLELTNGCSQLFLAEPEGLRFILASGMLAFGGVCVWLQTASVTKGLGTGYYLPGKAVQTVISVVLASIAQNWVYPVSQRSTATFPVPALIILAGGIICFNICKKHSSNLAQQGV